MPATTRRIVRLALPLEGPLSRDAFFADRAVPGLRPCKRLGLGTAGLGGVWRKVGFEQSVRALHDAWTDGHALVDTSPHYAQGQSELVLGEALREWHGHAPLLLTKLEGYPPFAPPEYAADWRASFEKQHRTSHERFHRRQIDGLAMHDPEVAPPEFEERCAEYLCGAKQRGDIGAAGMGGGGPDRQSRWLATDAFTYAITYKRVSAVTLQGLADIAPAAHRHCKVIIVASPIMMGLLGSGFEAMTARKPGHIEQALVDRAKRVKPLADEAGLPLSQLAIRFVLSIPSVDFVLSGACTPQEWRDTHTAYEAGPLPRDLYERVWTIAQSGEEAIAGG